MPPLRKRPEDIPVLTELFSAKLQCRDWPQVARLHRRRDLELMRKYRWPGNVRELKNVVERAVVLARGDFIDAGRSHADEARPPRATRATPCQPSELSSRCRSTKSNAVTFSRRSTPRTGIRAKPRRFWASNVQRLIAKFAVTSWMVSFRSAAREAVNCSPAVGRLACTRLKNHSIRPTARRCRRVSSGYRGAQSCDSVRWPVRPRRCCSPGRCGTCGTTHTALHYCPRSTGCRSFPWADCCSFRSASCRFGRAGECRCMPGCSRSRC